MQKPCDRLAGSGSFVRMGGSSTRSFVAQASGWLTWPGGEARCALGRSGVTPASSKREGDGATPLGAWEMRRVFFRPDRQDAPSTQLAVLAIRPDMGWCDDPSSSEYNRLVTLPFPHTHEEMWRGDRLYDLVVELGYNDDPVVAGAGSAIFLHVAAAGFTPTEGCVATDIRSLVSLLAVARVGDSLFIVPGQR